MTDIVPASGGGTAVAAIGSPAAVRSILLKTRAPSKACATANPSNVASTTPPGFISNPSILLTHGAPADKAFVLLHGLTASPEQFSELGRLLYARGANVLIPRLPHHGYSDRLTTALEALTAEELERFAHDAVHQAWGLGKRTIVAGFSVGGLLASWIAQQHPVDRAVCIAPFLGVNGMPFRAGPRAARLLLRMPNRFLWWHPLRRERLMPEHGYPRYPTHAVAQALRLAQLLFEAADQRAPRAREIAMVLNASETTVSNRNARRLAAMWEARVPGSVELELLDGLPPSHDIIEPLRMPAVVAKIYPRLVDLIDP
jgi:alpha-beta hydrolase superfamily lysophospholipase